jgi:hypothetical protein
MSDAGLDCGETLLKGASCARDSLRVYSGFLSRRGAQGVPCAYRRNLGFFDLPDTTLGYRVSWSLKQRE